MKTCFKYLAFMVMLGASIVGYSQTIWQDIEYGMTAEQIKNLYPNAYVPNKPGKYKDGYADFLKVDNLKLVNESFTVIFIGKDNRVSWVQLSLNNGYTARQCEVIFETLSHALTSRYGDEKSSKNDRYGKTINWTAPNLDISLIFLPDLQMVNVNYESVIYSENEKL
jgi:hypothetical protein